MTQSSSQKSYSLNNTEQFINIQHTATRFVLQDQDPHHNPAVDRKKLGYQRQIEHHMEITISENLLRAVHFDKEDDFPER